MSCSNCNKELEIVNKYFKLCQRCNNLRLHDNEFGKVYKNVLESNKSRRSAIISPGNKRSKSLFSSVIKIVKDSKLELDEAFYEECFKNSDHKCEECGINLPTEFRSEDGRVIARWRYSHIVAKSIAPELRHNIDNINHLCLVHHTQWDHGDRKNMKIFTENCKKFAGYLIRR